MTFAALDLGVLPGQRKPRLRVAVHGKGCGFKALFGMAKVALVAIGLRSELSAVWFRVARVADQFAGFVPGIAALGLMALRATQRRMFSLQRESAAPMGHAVK